MNKKIRGILITNNVYGQSVQMGYFDSDMQSIYNYLECDIVESVVRYINHTPYRLLIDETGMFRKERFITAISKDGQERIVGNILIVSSNVDKDGNMLSLGDLDIQRIYKSFDLVRFKLFYDFTR